MKALFLSNEQSMAGGGGGQQVCSREFSEALTLAGFDLTNVFYTTDRSWATRLRRKLRPRPYGDVIPEEFYARVARTASAMQPAYVFSNLCDFIPAGPTLRAILPPDTRLVLLSHGLASVDDVHGARIARRYGDAAYVACPPDGWIETALKVETECLPMFDHVFTLAPFEVEITRWLGARSVSSVPRALGHRSPLDWKPVDGRVGCIGTFDHPPNFEGIELLCDALQRSGSNELRVRVISHSREALARLCRKYPFVDDLGPMNAPGESEAEAATWFAFLHPIFCFARGCSTKLATGIEWGLPVLTTPAGVRGYEWREGGVMIARSPEEFAKNVKDVCDKTRAGAIRDRVLLASSTAPTLPEVAAQMSRSLAALA